MPLVNETKRWVEKRGGKRTVRQHRWDTGRPKSTDLPGPVKKTDHGREVGYLFLLKRTGAKLSFRMDVRFERSIIVTEYF